MTYQKHCRAFTALLIALAVTGAASDFVAIRQTYEVERTDRLLAHNSDVLEQFARMGMALRDYLQARISDDNKAEAKSLGRLNEHYQSTKYLDLPHSMQAQLTEIFEPIFNQRDPQKIRSLIDQSSESIGMTITEIRNTQKSEVRALTELSHRQVRSSRLQILVASIFNLAFITGIYLVWRFYEYRRRENEATMESAVTSSKVMLNDLQALLDRRAQELRSTIHDLKNPLGSIKGFSDLINEDLHNAMSVAEMSHAIHRLSNHSLSLVNSLLKLEETRGAGHEPRNVNAIAYIEDVCYALKPQLATKNQHLHVDHITKTATVFGEPKKLWDLLMNIIGNAVKFSPPYSRISVRSKIQPGFVRIEIEDQGPGFSESDRTKIFSEFQKLSAQPTGGEISTGLGLMSARNAILAMSGQLEIAPRPSGCGALLIVTLPLFNSLKSTTTKSAEIHI